MWPFRRQPKPKPKGVVAAHPNGIMPDAWPILRRILDEEDIQTIREHDLQIVPFTLLAYQVGEGCVTGDFDALERTSGIKLTTTQRKRTCAVEAFTTYIGLTRIRFRCRAGQRDQLLSEAWSLLAEKAATVARAGSSQDGWARDLSEATAVFQRLKAAWDKPPGGTLGMADAVQEAVGGGLPFGAAITMAGLLFAQVNAVSGQLDAGPYFYMGVSDLPQSAYTRKS